MNKDAQAFPIVGVGASAGGIEALESFFRGMPDDPGAAFVVVTHLNPERESILHEIIGRYTNMAVHIAANRTRVTPNAVYVLPADAILSISEGVLAIRKPDPAHRERKPIDIFLSSLAQDQGETAIAVILSGGDGDGTLGTKAIKAHGGLTFAQISKDAASRRNSPEHSADSMPAHSSTPAYPSMPQSAISTGFVDFALPAEQMGARIVEFVRSLNAVGTIGETVTLATDEALEAACRQIYAILRQQVGHDFGGYKNRTFLRRVHRRMQVVQLDSIEVYVECLRQEPAEVNALFRDLLINVTNFFRDTAAFEKLQELVVPKLFEGRGAQDTVRVWVPGCATGEEVFSIAMLLREYADTLTEVPRIQIFATDIDEHALSVARAGRYPEALLDSVSPARRHRFFVAEGGSYVLTKEVRDLCIFSPHSVIRDPPFSRIDLVSCRNLLIYFGSDVQNQVIPIFHYALRPGGYLFLGTSENVTQFADLFEPVEKEHRIFRSRQDSTIRMRLPPLMGNLRAYARAVEPPPRRAAVAGLALRQTVEHQVLEHFAPAHLVANRDGDIVFFSAKTGKYVEPSAGAPNRQLLTMARKGLRLDLRTMFLQAIQTNARLVHEHLAVEGDDGRVQMVTLTVEPIDPGPERREAEPLYLVLFTDEGPSVSREVALDRSPQDVPAALDVLERELRETRERLQLLIEEYETALEELKSANEELVSLNEELQSTNEEMEASKEELQSLNEEMHTVNTELTGKIEALDASNSDLENLFESSQIATVFLDHDLVIRSYTPAVARIFNILPGDRGRPLTDLSSRLPLPALAADVQEVFTTGGLVERRIEHEDSGSHFLVRLVPYRTRDGSTEGVVATFIDVTVLTQAEAHQRVLIAELNHRVKNMLSIVIAIATQTMKSSPSMEEFSTAYIARLHAMARSYELLSRENWTEASIDQLSRQELTPFGLERVDITGPEIRLKPKQALSVGMILHELATNAGKYGGLSQPGGRVSLTWSVDAEASGEHIVLLWRESGGPPVHTPAKRGFGLRLVEREAAYSLLGKADIVFQTEGIVVTLDIRLPPPAGPEGLASKTAPQ